MTVNFLGARAYAIASHPELRPVMSDEVKLNG